MYKRQERELRKLAQFLNRRDSASNARVTISVHSRGCSSLGQAINRQLDRHQGERIAAEEHASEMRQGLTYLSHDIRTPLAGAKGYAQLLEDEGDVTARRRYLEAIARRIDDASKLLDQLFAYAQVQDPDCLLYTSRCVSETAYVLEDVARAALAYRDSIEYDPDALAENQDRMVALQGLMRAFGPRIEDVLARRDEAADLVSLVDDSAERVRRARAEAEKAESELAEAANALDEARREAAPRFAQAVSRQMARLAMGGASIECSLERQARGQWTKTGPSRFEFLVRPAEGCLLYTSRCV